MSVCRVCFFESTCIYYRISYPLNLLYRSEKYHVTKARTNAREYWLTAFCIKTENIASDQTHSRSASGKMMRKAPHTPFQKPLYLIFLKKLPKEVDQRYSTYDTLSSREYKRRFVGLNRVSKTAYNGIQHSSAAVFAASFPPPGFSGTHVLPANGFDKSSSPGARFRKNPFVMVSIILSPLTP